MTKGQRNRIYTACLGNLHQYHYICVAIASNQEYAIFNIFNYPEIIKHKPSNKKFDEPWFSNDYEGHEKRLSILRQAIHETL